MNLPVMLTVKELSQATHMKEWFIRKAVRDGWLPCIRSGDGGNAPMLFEQEAAAKAIHDHMKPLGKTNKGDVVYLKRANGM